MIRLKLHLALLLAAARTWGRWLIAERRRADAYHPHARHRAAGTALQLAVAGPAVGVAPVVYPTRLTARPSLAATVAAWWARDGIPA